MYLMYIDDPLKRDFYIEISRLERWSSRELQKRLDSMLYERTALSKQPDDTIRHDLDQLRNEQQVSPNLLLKDPYILDFLDLNDRYLEKDLEDAILRDIEKFLLEWEQALPSSPAKNACKLTTMIFTLTSSSTTANSNG